MSKTPFVVLPNCIMLESVWKQGVSVRLYCAESVPGAFKQGILKKEPGVHAREHNGRYSVF